ncbi:SNF2 family N-terminal domain-containing protein [Whalleya microplaca]|nr:SNF2 family N-terminal domain-containing protein [Whalleya microplaca]
MSRKASVPSGGSLFIPGTPGMDRRSQANGRPQPSDSTWIEIDDDDLDELVAASVPCSSPYFTQPTQIVTKTTQPTQIVNRTTQPTQIVNRATQPTQIIDRAAPKQPSSPLAPSSPSTAVEVPASSPFQPKSQTRPSSVVEKKPQVVSRVGSLMAPAGTSFRPPTMQKSVNRANGPLAKRSYVNISDDDIAEDYKKRRDSSDDDRPMRGDIRPSSFMKKDGVSSSASTPKSGPLPKKALTLNDIHDVRLRHLTSQVHRIMLRRNPGITVQACKDALLKDVGWQVSKAVELLDRKTAKAPSVSKTSNSTSGSSSISDLTGAKSLGLASSSRNTLHNFVQRPSAESGKSSSTPKLTHSAHPAHSSHPAHSTHSSHPAQSTHSINSANTRFTNKKMPRGRLIQGRRNKSPTPPAVFSVSSSATSLPTTPAQSDENSPASSQGIAKMAHSHASSDDEAPVRPRRRLLQGRRNRTPPAPIVTLDSDSDSSLPQPKKLLSRKRKAETNVEPEQLEVLSDSDNGAQFAGTPDLDSSGENGVIEKQNVLNYLNTCTAEELGRMTGLPVDAKLMVSSRPFKSIDQAEKVSRKDKSRSKAKAKKTQVGELIVEKLSSWFQACEAAATVIKECEKRGSELQSAMATWPMDKNGGIKTPSNSILDELPIAEKPELMDESIQLKSYQLLGLNWMSLLHSKGYSGILADDMGLGKTCQVISFIAHLVGTADESDERPHWPNLIVVPPSTYENWMSEFERFAPEISVLPYSGSSRRNIEIEEAQEHHVVLTTYSQVERQAEDLAWLQALDPYAAIFDEGHKLKNRSTLIYRQMMRVPTQWRLVLSGTPVQNNLKELLTLLHFIEPSLFEEDDFERLNTIFEAKVPSKDVHNFAALAEGRVDRARAVIAPFILQRRKSDVLDLAKKNERNEVVDMHPDQKSIYDEIKGRYLLPKGTKRDKSTIKESNPWMQLRKAAIHHQLFRRHFSDSRVEKMVDILWKNCSAEELYIQSKEERHRELLLEDFKDKSDFQLHLWCKDFPKYIGHLDIVERSWEESPKVQKLLELVRGYMKSGDRCLVFSRFEMVIDILRETFHHADIPYCELTGNTVTAERFPEIQRFDENPHIPVFLLTTGAGGTGLNLTAANKVILFDQSDNPQDDVQASNRAHRIGQTRDVEVIRLITKNSVEGLVYNSCVKKLMLAAYVEGQHGVDDGNEESVEEQCRKLMLLETEVEMRATQLH